MKQIKSNVILILIAVFGGWGSYSCTGMDDYLKYTDGKEIIYTGKVDSLHFRSGRERIVFSGLLISDPNIAKVSVFWNSRKDSLIIPIQKSTGIDTLMQEIKLKEGAYNFEVYTFSKENRPSVPTYVTGKSYGDRYESGLYERPIKNVTHMRGDGFYPDGYVLVEWYNADPTSFVLIDYRDMNHLQRRRVISAASDTSILDGCNPLTEIKMQTCYLPDAYAIDTFRVGSPKIIRVDADITEMYIKNAGAGNSGIKGNYLNGNSEWGEPVDWIVTDPVKVNAHQHGWANRDGGVLHPETWGSGDFENGKIYQPFTLPKGIYELSYYCVGSAAANNDWNKINAYFVAAKGVEPPDIYTVESDENVLGLFHGNGTSFRDWHSITFTLNEETEINIGFVFNLKNESQFRIKEIKLMYKAK